LFFLNSLQVFVGRANNFFGKELFGRYDLGPAYDESFAGPGEPRPNYEALYKYLLQLPDDELAHRQSAADLSFLQQGITFTVYVENQGTERIFPYDLLPRLITSSEWQTIERGLAQRITALNLFLKDIYHEGKIFKNGVLPRELIYSSRHYRREMRGIKVPRDAYVAIAGTMTSSTTLIERFHTFDLTRDQPNARARGETAHVCTSG
jgi:uncharacterized circularly permuted ATP-grasp superfamily protein